MAFQDEDIQANRRYFQDKLRATRQMLEVGRLIREGKADFLLLDTRRRESFAQGHIQGAWCAPLEELRDLIKDLPKYREIVTYCSNAL
jgi:rhodanese-related sulfurtransferase